MSEIKTMKGLQNMIDELSKMPQSEIEKEQKLFEEQERERNEQNKQSYYECKSGVSPRYWKESLDTYKAETEEEKNNLEYIKKFAHKETKKNMLLLLGRYGTGKTHLGAGIVRETYGTFASSSKICLQYEMGSDYNAPKNRLQVLEEYSNCPNLVIDEIGRSYSNIEQKVLSYIINQRYENNLSLVLISNLKKDDVIKLLGEPIIDRLKECCSTLAFNGRSRRSENE